MNITRRTALRGATAALAALALPVAAEASVAPSAALPADPSLREMIFAWIDLQDEMKNLADQIRSAPDQATIDHLSNLRMFRTGPAEKEARNAMLRAIYREARAKP